MWPQPGPACAPSITLRTPTAPKRTLLLFLDHAKDRYLASLEDLEPRLRPGAVVVADNVLAVDGGASLAPYLARVRSPAYAESALHEAPLEYADGGERDGVEVSIFR